MMTLGYIAASWLAISIVYFIIVRAVILRQRSWTPRNDRVKS